MVRRLPATVKCDTWRMGSPARDLTAAAVDLFYEQGAQATTVREITKACGLTAGALYNHFTSKEELLASRSEFEKQTKDRRKELNILERRLAQKEENLD